MMKIIVPQSVQSIALRFRSSDEPYSLRFVLRHHDRRATGCALAHAIGDLRENVNLGSIVNVLRSVHAKSVEMKFLNPVSCVGNEKFAHRPGIGPVEIERFAPVGGMAVGKIIRRKIFQVVSCGSSMIVNDVQNDAQAESMRKIDKGAKIIGAAVESGRSEKIDTVIAPSEAAIEIVNRHDFQDGYSQTLQFRELLACRRPGAFGCERADMHFVNHLSFYRQSIPLEVMPEELSGIDDHGWAQRTFGLKSRRGVRYQEFVTVQAIAIEISGFCQRTMPGEISVGFGVQLNDALGASFATNDDFDFLTAWRPDAKMNLAVFQNFRANGESSCISTTGLGFRR